MFAKYKKTLFFLLGFVALSVLGLVFGLRSWDQNLYVSWDPVSQRGLAEEDKEQLLIHLSSEELTMKADNVLFEGARVIEEEDQLTFYLGDVLVPDKSKGKYRFLCELYSHIEFSFSPVGIKLSGEPGWMIVQSPCQTEQEFELGPFVIPKKKLFASPEKASFEFEEIETYISFYHSSLILTPSWILQNVRFFNESYQEEKNQADGDEHSEDFIIRYDRETQAPFEIFLQEKKEVPELILKQRDQTS